MTDIDLIGSHGQTLWHEPPVDGMGSTLQLGEPAVIAEMTGVPVVSNFRTRDMAVGGQGAPLVPLADALLLSHPTTIRAIQNIGGIANLTAIAAGVGSDRVLAFDTGPGNMVIDAVTQRLFKRAFDDGGRIAATGKVIEPVLTRLLTNPFFRAKPPKTAGREEFGRDFVREFVRLCGRAGKQDVVATATALTARSIADAIDRFVLRKSKDSFQELILSGGGAKNATLVAMLRENLTPRGIAVRFSDEFGLPSQAKEAIAFAVLAYETWHRRPSNIPSATGASRPAILGKISYA